MQAARVQACLPPLAPTTHACRVTFSSPQSVSRSHALSQLRDRKKKARKSPGRCQSGCCEHDVAQSEASTYTRYNSAHCAALSQPTLGRRQRRVPRSVHDIDPSTDILRRTGDATGAQPAPQAPQGAPVATYGPRGARAHSRTRATWRPQSSNSCHPYATTPCTPRAPAPRRALSRRADRGWRGAAPLQQS